MIEAWKKFFGTGWLYGKEPSKQDCFKAGYEAAMKELCETCGCTK